MPFIREIKNIPCIDFIADFFSGRDEEIYLVGGALRDIFLKRVKPVLDFDFAVSRNAIKIARSLARKLNCPFVVLDQEHGSCRIVYCRKNISATFDFTDFRGKDINEDILHRDFTINSMAFDLSRIDDKRADVIDQFGARKDILAKKIRVISQFSIKEDPLRILRAFSLSAGLAFKIDKASTSQIKKYRRKISSCAAERISEEIYKIFDARLTFKTVEQMASFGILDEILPELKKTKGVHQGPYHHLDVFKHSLETLRQAEKLLEELRGDKDIESYLNRIISGTHTLRSVLKIGALLHDIGKPQSRRFYKGKICFHGHERIGKDLLKGICQRMRFSNDEREALSRLIFWHLRPGYMADIDDLSQRAIFRFFRDTADMAPLVLLVSIADQRSTRGPLTRGANRKHHEGLCLNLIKEYFRKQKEKKLPKLVDGSDIMKNFKLAPGPLIGKILQEIEEAQAASEIKTKEEAFELAGGVIAGTNVIHSSICPPKG